MADLDLLVLGSGVAGLTAAVRAADTHRMRVGVITKGALAQATTRWAQGGVAAALGGDPDSTDLHHADTLAAGAGLCDRDAVRILVDEGPTRVHELIGLGAIFDRDADGRLELAREGGHSLARIVHAGGAATGAEIERALVAAVQRSAAVVQENTFVLDLIVEGGRCRGVTVIGADGLPAEVRADNVLLTTGGAGQLFAVTTNPAEATGDGIAMALRAGVAVADLEFTQFHPTALAIEAMPRPLLTEALRGHGAILRDTTGEQFVDELLPRDRVSRASMWRMAELGTDHVLLDVRHLHDFEGRFPNIAADLRLVGLDPAVDLLPVAPAAHYTCGGILTDLDGASSLPGLWAAGEVACSGVHGANRLASNSLLEGMVFGPRVIEAIEAGTVGSSSTGAMRSLRAAEGRGADATPIGGRLVSPPPALSDRRDPSGDVDTPTRRRTLQRMLTDHAGVLRDADRLSIAAGWLDGLLADLQPPTDGHEQGKRVTPTPPLVRDPAFHELRNLATVGRVMVEVATMRTESRGSHTRDDHPDVDPALAIRFVVT